MTVVDKRIEAGMANMSGPLRGGPVLKSTGSSAPDCAELPIWVIRDDGMTTANRAERCYRVARVCIGRAAL